MKKQVTHFTRPKPSYTRQYIYHNEDILAELDGNNNLVAFYIHGPGIDTPLAMMRDRNLDGIIKNNEVFVYTRDHQSSVRELTNLNGVVVQRYDYTAYGETTVELNGEIGDRLIENPYGYTGRVLDRETGCYYYRARWYCPSLRPFLSPDPIGFARGTHTVDFNPYAYVRNNPVNYVDPDGRIVQEIAFIAVVLALAELARRYAFDFIKEDSIIRNSINKANKFLENSDSESTKEKSCPRPKKKDKEENLYMRDFEPIDF